MTKWHVWIQTSDNALVVEASRWVVDGNDVLRFLGDDPADQVAVFARGAWEGVTKV